MLVALVNSEPGLRKAAALVLLSVSAIFGVGLFGAQLATPDRFGCVYSGEDFFALYSSARLVLQGEGAAIFEPTRRLETEAALKEEAGSKCGPLPAAYWPGFLLPVLPLTLFAPRTAYYLWVALSIGLILFACWRLSRADGLRPWGFWFVAVGFFPVTIGLLSGQLHPWQVLALSEFWLAWRRRADRAAGLWLSIQVVKPHYVPLMLLYLAWQRAGQALRWFMAASAAWLIVSVLLAGGFEGVAAYVRLYWDTFVPVNAASQSVSQMINWRALALVWFGAGGTDLVGVTTAICSGVTVGLIVWSWRLRPQSAAALEPQAFLTLTVAVLLVGYYTHLYSVSLLLVPSLPLLGELGRAHGWRTRFWSVLMDIVLLGPSLMAIALLSASPALWIAANQALLLLLTVVLLADVFVSLPQRVNDELVSTNARRFADTAAN